MAKTFLVSSEFMGKTAEFAVGCAALATGMVMMPVAAPAIGLAAIFGSAWLSKLVRERPDCETAAKTIFASVSRDFAAANDADEADVRAAEKALSQALSADGLFSQDALRRAWMRSERVAEGMASVVLEAVILRDTSFAGPGMRHDFAREVLDRVFVAAIQACSQFREIATLTGVETAVGQGRALADQIAAMEARLTDLAKGTIDPSLRPLIDELNVRMGELGVPPSERQAWLTTWVAETIAALRDRSNPTNEGIEFDALRKRAFELLFSDPERAASPFMSALERDDAEEQERQAYRRHKRDQLWAEAVEMDVLALRFDEAADKLWRQAGEIHTDPLDRARLMMERAIEDARFGERHPGLGRLLLAVAGFRRTLEIYTRADMPADWATTQNNLGSALQTLGERSGGEAGVRALNAAVDAYRAALEIRTRADMPAQWAGTQNNLGIALATLGERAGGEAGVRALNEAVDAYRAALEIYTRADMPAQWAMTRENLCLAEATLAELTQDPQPVCAAADAMIDVIAVYEAMQADYYSEKARRNRARMIEMCRALGGECSD